MDLPYLDKVVFRVLTDPMTQVSALKAGEVDLLNSVSPELVRVLERDRSVTVLSGVQTTPMVAMLQLSKPPFDDLRTRTAIGCSGHEGPRQSGCHVPLRHRKGPRTAPRGRL
jgi:peptide/nickel transport system substrate-binding protein